MARPDILARWLCVVAVLVALIVVIGGITRLTESGLSITEWKPVTGIFPPTNDGAWDEEFEKYKKIPEYQEINAGMSLAAFKSIYFWEWLHRLWGRLIGAAMAVPLVWFAWRGMIPVGFGWRLTGLLLLIGLQGLIGWWMVASGLELRSDVSHFRLGVHLVTALVILAGLVWTAADLSLTDRIQRSAQRVRQEGAQEATLARFGIFAAAIVLLLLLQSLMGAWTAGLNAGQVAKDWPLMSGSFFPHGVDWSQGLAFAVGNDPFLVHFLHRWFAWVVATGLLLLAFRLLRSGEKKLAFLVAALTAGQVSLGIITVMTGVGLVPSLLHQTWGAVLVVGTVLSLHRLGVCSKETV